MAMATLNSAVTTSLSLVSPSCCSPRVARCSADSGPSTSLSVSNALKFPLFCSPVLQQVKADGSSISGNQRDSILDPALQHANLMWFRGSYNAQIFVSEDEPADSVVRRFRRAVMQAGVIPECRRRRFFETPQDIAKRKLLASHRRNKSRRFTPRPDAFGENKGGGSKAVDDDDYWGYIEE